MTDWNNKEEVLEAVRMFGDNLQYASEELRADREVVLAAVKSDNDYALRYACKELRGDKEVVVAAINDWSDNIEFASEKLRADPEIAMTAIESVQCGDEMPAYGIHEVLMKDKEFLLQAISAGNYTKNPFILILKAHKDLWKEKEFVLLAIETIRNAHSYRIKFNHLRTIDPMDKITSLNSLWRKIDNSLKSDQEILLEAAKWDAQLRPL